MASRDVTLTDSLTGDIMAGGGDAFDPSLMDSGVSSPFDTPYDPSVDPYAATSTDTSGAPAAGDPSQYIYDPATDSYYDPTSGAFFDASVVPTASANDTGYIPSTTEVPLSATDAQITGAPLDFSALSDSLASQGINTDWSNVTPDDIQALNAVLGVDPNSSTTPAGWTDQQWSEYQTAVAGGGNPFFYVPSTAPVYSSAARQALSGGGGGASAGGGSKGSSSQQQSQQMQALLQALAKLGSNALQKQATPTVQRSLLPGQLTPSSNPTSGFLLAAIALLAFVLIYNGRSSA